MVWAVVAFAGMVLNPMRTIPIMTRVCIVMIPMVRIIILVMVVACMVVQ